MGVISRTIQDNTVLVDGYPLEGTIYYIYCDRCGSFNIRGNLKAIHWLLVIFMVVFSALFYKYLLLQRLQAQDIYLWWTIYLFLIAVIIGLFSRYFPHKCMQCGNTNITYQDTLGYSKDDAHFGIDVPEHKLHKHNEKKIEFSKDLKAFLLVLLFVILLPLYFFFVILALVWDCLKKKKTDHA